MKICVICYFTARTLNSHFDLCTSQPTLTSDRFFQQVGVNWSSCIQKIKPKSRTTNHKTSHVDCPLPAQQKMYCKRGREANYALSDCHYNKFRILCA